MKRLPDCLAIFLLFCQQCASAQGLPQVKGTQFKTDTFNILKYGAAADGLTLNTSAINAAISQCCQNGGGVVLVPPGLWMTGPLQLQSNVNLHLAASAVLQFTADFTQYPLIAGNWEGVPAARNQSPLSASNAENIAITGHGIIDGNGDAWRAVKKEKLTTSQWQRLLASGGLVGDDGKTWYPSEASRKGAATKDAGILKDGKLLSDFTGIKDFLRPNLLVFTACKRILLDGITFQNSPAWCLHPLMCEDLSINNVTVKNPWYAQNGDGIDIESCKNVFLSNSVFDVGDDGICIKSGRDAEGRKRGRPTENVLVKNCTVYHAHGGFVIGSEMSGGAKNIYVTDCTFMGTDVGLRFKTTRGRGGVVEKIFIDRISMKDIAGEAILFDMYYMAKDPVPLAGEQRVLPNTEFKPVDETTPLFKDFHISHVYCNGARKAIFIRGLPEMHVSNLALHDMVLQSTDGIEIQEASNLQFTNIKLLTMHTNPVVDVLQSDHLSFEQMNLPAAAALLWRVSGDRTKSIRLPPGVAGMGSRQLAVDLGAEKKEIHIE